MAETYPPPEDFKSNALVQDESLYDEAEQDFEAFWASHAEKLRWSKEWDSVLEWNPPHAKWFPGGELNMAENCLDRHIDEGHGDQVAFYWEGEPVDQEDRSYTYSQLRDEVAQMANALSERGVTRDDIVTIYLPMVPELVVAMLACARLGVAHSVVFAGFSAGSLQQRIEDASAKFLITADGSYRGGKQVTLKEFADKAMDEAGTIEHCIVVRRLGDDIEEAASMTEGRDEWYDEIVPNQSTECEPVQVEANDMLFILYSSGSTGKPKGIQHGTGGYMTHVGATHRLVFDIKSDTDVFWCAADIGWVTGHSYIVYGPLLTRTTSIIYEGAPSFPDYDRFWQIIEKYKATILYTAPTTIRAFMKAGEEYIEGNDLSSLRLLGSVGEPINPEAWQWYHQHIGGGNCPIVDTWWQTETGGIMITPLPGLQDQKPGSAMRPFPGIKAVVLDDDGEELKPNAEEAGALTLQRPWPGMLQTLFNDDERYQETYWSTYGPEIYFAGDGAKVDEDGDLWLVGRIDDVMNVSGHRMSTTEIESALVEHEQVAEAAVVGREDPDTGQAIAAFVSLKGDAEGSDDLAKELRDYVGEQIGKIARPAQVFFTPDLPKTRSGKIMRRILKSISEGEDTGDTSTLANPEVVDQIEEKSFKQGQ